ncbi:hypothetical protein [Streptomyces hydrogenans]
MGDVLVRIAGHFGDDSHSLLRRITSARWDTLALHVRGDGAGSTVGLEEAACALRAGTEMIRLSALHTDNPYRLAWGSRRSAPVAEYLRDGVRLGPTDGNDVTFPLLSRVWQDDAGVPAFGRNVMMNLTDSLARIQGEPAQDTASSTETLLFDAAIAKCLGALLHVENVTVSFRWHPEPSLAIPPAAHDSFTFDAARLRGVAARRARSDAPKPARTSAGTRPQNQPSTAPRAESAGRSPRRFTGRITVIGVNHHSLRPGQSPYFLVLKGREGEFFLPVGPEDYSFALRARKAGTPVSAIGFCNIHAGRRIVRGSLVRDEGVAPRRLD